MLKKLAAVLKEKYPHLKIENTNIPLTQEEFISIYYHSKTKDGTNHWVLVIYNDRIRYPSWVDRIAVGVFENTDTIHTTPVDPGYFQTIEEIIQRTTNKIRLYYELRQNLLK